MEHDLPTTRDVYRLLRALAYLHLRWARTLPSSDRKTFELRYWRSRIACWAALIAPRTTL